MGVGIWPAIIAQTSKSPAMLLAFGGACIAASIALGSLFTTTMTPAPLGKKPHYDGLTVDDKVR